MPISQGDLHWITVIENLSRKISDSNEHDKPIINLSFGFLVVPLLRKLPCKKPRGQLLTLPPFTMRLFRMWFNHSIIVDCHCSRDFSRNSCCGYNFRTNLTCSHERSTSERPEPLKFFLLRRANVVTPGSLGCKEEGTVIILICLTPTWWFTLGPKFTFWPKK